MWRCEDNGAKVQTGMEILLGWSQTPATSPNHASDKSLRLLNFSLSSSFFGIEYCCCLVWMLGFWCLTNYFFIVPGFSKTFILLFRVWCLTEKHFDHFFLDSQKRVLTVNLCCCYIYGEYWFWDNLLGYLFSRFYGMIILWI